MVTSPIVSGNIFIFQAFDIGEEIDLKAVSYNRLVTPIQHALPKYFKNYHIPLSIMSPVLQAGGVRCEHAKLHNFGAISLRYRIPFATTLEDLRTLLVVTDENYSEYGWRDAEAIFNRIKKEVKQPRFFQGRNDYVLIQMDELPGGQDLNAVKQEYGHLLASLLRFETESLSEHVRDEILMDAFSYYHKDLIIIDTQAALLCDDEYDEVLDLFDFANVQHLELQFFDRILDTKLNLAYEQDKKSPPLRSYLPFIGMMVSDPVGELSRLKVDISVITDRLETSIKLAGEVYISQLYEVLSEKLDLANWKESIGRKLSIIQDIGSIYEHKLEVIREDLLTCSIIILILLELIMGFLMYQAQVH
jgi:hypothetical protein